MKKTLLLLVPFIAILLLAPAAGQLTPVQVTDNSYDDYDPQIALDSSGNAYLTWVGYEGGSDSEIFWAKVSPAGVVTGPVQVTTNTYFDTNPQIAVDSSGNSYLTWFGFDGNDWEIFWAKVSPAGVVTGPVQVTTNTYDDGYQQIALDSSGNSYLTWYGSEGGSDYEIFWAKVSPAGVVTGPVQVTTNTYDDVNPQIALDSSGNSYLTWYGSEGGSDGEIFWAKVSSTGVVTGPIQVTTNTYVDTNPQIAIDSSGNSYLIWEGYEGGSDWEIFWAKVDSTGVVTNGPIQVTTNTYDDYGPQIAADSSGNSYLIWEGYEGGSDWEIFWAKVSSAGVVTGPVQVTTNSYGDLSPQIAADSSGNAYLTWYGNEGGDDDEIFWAKVSSAGVVTGPVQVTTNTYTDIHPQIAIDSSGNSYLVWYGSDGHDCEIFFLYVVGTGTSSPSPLIFKVLADTQLARASVMWECISGNLPADITAEVQEMIDAVQTHMANAASLSNPIYSNGELVKAIGIMEDISEELDLDCWCD